MRSVINLLLKPVLIPGNAFVRWLMRSRLHWLLSGNVVLLEVRGRKSGKLYLVPVNYREFHPVRGSRSSTATDQLSAGAAHASSRPGRAGDTEGGSRRGPGGGPQAETSSKSTSAEPGIIILTYRGRKWWRNLQGVETMFIHLRGERVETHVELVLDDLAAIAQALTERGWMRKAVADAQAEESVLIRLRLKR